MYVELGDRGVHEVDGDGAYRPEVVEFQQPAGEWVFDAVATLPPRGAAKYRSVGDAPGFARGVFQRQGKATFLTVERTGT